MSARRLLVLLLLPAWTLTTSAGQAQGNSPRPTPEPPAPAATPVVQKQLDTAAALEREKKPAESLTAVDRALTVAKEATDAPGVALAHEFRARRLEAMGKPAEAAAAWQGAGAAWKEAGYGPGQVLALLGEALLLPRDQAEGVGKLLSDAGRVAREESRRPLTGAGVLGARGLDFFSRGRLGEAQTLWLDALTIREKLAPGSLDEAVSRTQLGNVAFVRGDLSGAKGFYERSLAIREKLAPGSLEVAGSLNGLGNVARGRGDLMGARALYERALAIREKLAPGSLDLAGSLNNLGLVAYNQGDLPGAQALYERALAIKERLAPGSLDVAKSLYNVGSVAHSRADLGGAKVLYEQSLAIHEKLAPGSLDVAFILNGLGNVLNDQGDPAQAQTLWERSLAIREKLAPGSPDVAGSLHNLGRLAYNRRDMSEARALWERELAIREKLAPGSLDVALSLSNLGSVVSALGDLTGARSLHERSLEIRERLAPGSLDVALSLNNLGNLAQDRGDLAGALSLYAGSLEIQEKLAPGSLGVAASLNNLGNLAQKRGDLAGSRSLHQRSLEIKEKLSPGSLVVAQSLHNLANVVYAQRDLAEAKALWTRSVEINEKLAPGSGGLAASLTGLGSVAKDQGDPEGAKAYYRRALAIWEKRAPDSSDVAFNLASLGKVAYRQGDLAGTRTLYDRALAIYEKLAPGSLDVAECVFVLAVIAERRKDLALAESLTARAWKIVLAQGRQVAGDEARQAFGSAKGYYAAQLIQLQIGLGKSGDALGTLEEGRAQALLQLLAERGLDRQAADPERWTAYEIARKELERAGTAISNAAQGRNLLLAQVEDLRRGSPDAATAEALKLQATEADRTLATARAEYVRKRVEMEGKWAAARASMAKTLPPPMTSARARSSLGLGTLFLGYLVGEKESTLFLVTGKTATVRAYRLKLREEEMRERVRDVRDWVLGEGSAGGRAAKELAMALFPPEARPAIAAAKRLVISPDGPLWDMPFAALPLPGAAKKDAAPGKSRTNGGELYLGLQKPTVYAQSLTLYALSTAGGGGVGGPRAVARKAPTALVVGNPLIDLTAGPDPGAPGKPVLVAQAAPGGEAALLTRDAGELKPLPGAEKEAVAIARLYGAQAAVGKLPTERWLRERCASADVIHLATHGFLSPHLAVNSGVFLATPAKPPAAEATDDDGVLQAWEIPSLKLKAQVVVLSACETGRGAKVPGEGLIGLTRALQVAGARSIVASQWKVSDASTRFLMESFHRWLRAGRSKDEAVRKAMAETAAKPSWKAPYYWAGFRLLGDPR